MTQYHMPNFVQNGNTAILTSQKYWYMLSQYRQKVSELNEASQAIHEMDMNYQLNGATDKMNRIRRLLDDQEEQKNNDQYLSEDDGEFETVSSARSTRDAQSIQTSSLQLPEISGTLTRTPVSSDKKAIQRMDNLTPRTNITKQPTNTSTQTSKTTLCDSSTQTYEAHHMTVSATKLTLNPRSNQQIIPSFAGLAARARMIGKFSRRQKMLINVSQSFNWTRHKVQRIDCQTLSQIGRNQSKKTCKLPPLTHQDSKV